ncbi:MAG: putative manganese-dependent inorganic diphosphatase [Eubacterium sp.]|nr:putative manganese-dependent inorganic diphosphatase [Candidatus Colimonas fimequi]
MNKREIIVIGHKNPDTDSICSAIAYSELKNRIDQNNTYVPMRAGVVSKETKYVLDRFGVEEPEYIANVGAQVMDMELRRTPGVSEDMTIREVWDKMGVNEAVTQPVIDEDEKIIGIITKGDIAKTFMELHDNNFLAQAGPTYGNIADTLRGEVVVGDKNQKFTGGKLLVGAAGAETLGDFISPRDIVILADRNEKHRIAIESGADCIILCVGIQASDDVRRLAEEKGTVIIETPLDSFSIAREINTSAPVGAVMIRDGIMAFQMTESIENVNAIMSNTRHRAFPVVGDDGKYIGTVSRRNFLNIQKKKVILVDHNEKTQAVDNIDDAEILEIVDHHRLGTLQTLEPIYFVNQPVGCTATILYEMFRDKNIELTQQMAGLLCAAIISDTLMFRSPTCTLKDKMAAGALGIIADINIEEFATEMFMAGSDLIDKPAEQIFYQDNKKFNFKNTTFNIGQISSMNEGELEVIKGKLIPILDSVAAKSSASMVFFLLTDIKKSSSEIICAGENAASLVEAAFPDAEKTNGGYMLEGVLSRKKQVVPAFMQAISVMEEN